MRLIISPDYEQCSQWAADYVAYKIKAAPDGKQTFRHGHSRRQLAARHV